MAIIIRAIMIEKATGNRVKICHKTWNGKYFVMDLTSNISFTVTKESLKENFRYENKIYEVLYG